MLRVLVRTQHMHEIRNFCFVERRLSRLFDITEDATKITGTTRAYFAMLSDAINIYVDKIETASKTAERL